VVGNSLTKLDGIDERRGRRADDLTSAQTEDDFVLSGGDIEAIEHAELLEVGSVEGEGTGDSGCTEVAIVNRGCVRSPVSVVFTKRWNGQGATNDFGGLSCASAGRLSIGNFLGRQIDDVELRGLRARWQGNATQIKNAPV